MTNGSIGLALLNRVVNPLVRAVLRSPAHYLVSGSLLLVTFPGRRSGKAYTIPVQYARAGETIYIVVGTPGRKQWWRNLGGPVPVSVRLCGRNLQGVANIVADPAAVKVGLSTYLQRFPQAARVHHIHRTANGTFDGDDLRLAAAQVVLVQVAIRPSGDRSELSSSTSR